MAAKISADPKVPLTLHVPVPLRNTVVAAAAISGQSLSQYVGEALRAHFKRAGG
jgi:uncharacterized protein (DUF1778 family)